MDTRIPPDGPRRPASLTHQARSHETPAAAPDAPAANPMDSAPHSPLATSAPRPLPEPRLAAPRLTQAHAQVHSVLHPPAAPAEQAALELLTMIAGSEVVDQINGSAQRIAQGALEVSTWRGATAELSRDVFMATRTGLIVGLLDSLEQVLMPGLSEGAEAELKDVQAAIADVGTWYHALDPRRKQAVRVSREDDYTCAISRKSFAEIEYPVAVRTGKVVHVFEAEDLLQWMVTSMQTPGNHGEATNPVDRAPLHLQQLSLAVNVLYAPVGPARR